MAGLMIHLEDKLKVPGAAEVRNLRTLLELHAYAQNIIAP